MNRLAWIVTIPVNIIVDAVCGQNRDPVALHLWPLPWDLGPFRFLTSPGPCSSGFFLGAASPCGSRPAKPRRRRRMLRQNSITGVRDQSDEAGLQAAQAAAPHRPNKPNPPPAAGPLIRAQKGQPKASSLATQNRY